ncbi:capping complex subunit for YIEGIA [Anaerosolibacter sp.]|uniref:capping complex subunit for YIEGIA n=1 Tax=Anaerosolibacter sp. TaxID=1872527 RepID=UPI0039EDF8E7
MDFGIKDSIVAIITADKNVVSSNSTPVFYASSEDHQERLALLIAKVTMGMVHDLENGTYVVVRH